MELSLEQIARSSYVRDAESEVRRGRLAVVIVLGVVFFPLTFALAYAALWAPEAFGWLERLVALRRPTPGVTQPVEGIECIRIDAGRVWWLEDGEGRVALLVQSRCDGLVVLRDGWPPHARTESGAHRKWMIYRDARDHTVLGVRAWGRCPTERVHVPTGALPHDGAEATVHTVHSLPPPLRAVVGMDTPYRS